MQIQSDTMGKLWYCDLCGDGPFVSIITYQWQELCDDCWFAILDPINRGKAIHTPKDPWITGMATIEYALLVVFIVCIAVLGVSLFGKAVLGLFQVANILK